MATSSFRQLVFYIAIINATANAGFETYKFFRATNKSNKPIKIEDERMCHALLLRIKKVNLMLMI